MIRLQDRCYELWLQNVRYEMSKLRHVWQLIYHQLTFLAAAVKFLVNFPELTTWLMLVHLKFCVTVNLNKQLK